MSRAIIHPVTGWVVAGLAAWCASAPVVAIAACRLLRGGAAGTTAVDELLHVPTSWTTAHETA